MLFKIMHVLLYIFVYDFLEIYNYKLIFSKFVYIRISYMWFTFVAIRIRIDIQYYVI